MIMIKQVFLCQVEVKIQDIFVDGNNLYYTSNTGNHIFIVNKVTGKPVSEPFPKYIYDNQQAAFSMSGGDAEFNLDIAVDENYLYYTDNFGNFIYLVNKITGQFVKRFSMPNGYEYTRAVGIC